MKLLVVVAACLAAAQAACPKLSAVQDFDVERFSGTWYNQAGLRGNYLVQGPGSCVKAVYTLDPNTGVVKVVNSAKTIIGSKMSIEGTAVLADPSKTEGNLSVTLKTVLGNQTAPLSCLKTDYDNFAIMYSCSEVLGVAVKSGWIMTRTQELKDAEKVEVEALITEAVAAVEAEGGPAYKHFHAVKQTGC